MKKSLAHISGLFKVIAVALALTTVMLQPLGNALFLLDKFDIEISEIDLEEDSEEKEDKKEDKKEDNLKLQYANAANESVLYLSIILSYQVNQPAQDFSLEIPIPPPEQV